MQNYRAVIRRAELLAMPPEAVAAFLKERAARPREELRNDDVDEEIERALLDRDDPLINLSLARHGRFVATLHLLFEKNGSKAVQFAVLSNTAADGGILSSFPVALFGDTAGAAEWLTAAPQDAITALFENPNLEDSFLRDLLEGGKPWNTIPDERLLLIVAALQSNKRMWQPYDDSFMDGYAEYSHHSVFNAAWKLAERMPVTDQWAAALCWLYDRLRPEAFSIENPLELAARWHPDPANANATARESSRWLSSYQGVRKGLARLALRKGRSVLPNLLSSDDPGLRAAAYADATLTPEQIGAAYEKDGELFFDQAVHNTKLWLTAAHREALKTVAWAVVRADKHSDMMAANIFNGVRERIAKEHPDWFKDDDEPAPDSGDKPATTADISALAEKLNADSNALAFAFDQVRQTVQRLNSRLGWVWWFSLGALVAIVARWL
jgi:hypothetical protein